ncbi:S-layer domain-containing protein [Gottschalkia purinilytica]|uniref:S-layer domain-containing protein n=1 Tax=Gottschalkia purinilytica TaxID=1503 RepID=A0A0L0WE74_GOTPU|nr:S-layer homology domain-containing protein [Gottschalkia purinilytica]KNF09769.1 S-layer domain-containing protein [Gottschalkia purinilytica]
MGKLKSKITTALVTASILITSLSSPIQGVSIATANSYEGIREYKELYNNINFYDVKNHWSRDSVYKMSALSVIKGMGQGRFNPEGILTKEEALTLIVRLLGLEGEGQRIGQGTIKKGDTGGYQILDAGYYWFNGHLKVASKSGIITKEEEAKIVELTEGQKKEIEREASKRLETYKANKNLGKKQLDEIKKQLNQKIQREYTWKKSISREQVAVWIARAAKLENTDGRNQQMVFNFVDWKSINTGYIPVIEAVVQKGIMSGDDKGRFNPKSPLKRSEMAKLMDNIHEDILKEQGYIIKVGTVDNVVPMSEYIEGSYIQKRHFSIKNDDNTATEISVKSSSNAKYNGGFIGYKNRQLVLPESINTYDDIKYYINNEGKVVFVEALWDKNASVKGVIENVDQNNYTISVKDYYGRIHNYNIIKEVDVKINGQGSNLSNLIYGQEVTLKLLNGKVVGIDGYLDTGDDGYIHPGERVERGTVLYVDKRYGEVTVISENKQIKYTVPSYTPILKNNVNVGIDGLKEGDIIKLDFDEYQGNTPIKIYILTENTKQISNIYKGEISHYNVDKNEIVLRSPSVYKQGKWTNESSQKLLPLKYNLEVFREGKAITKQQLKNYVGVEVYILSENNFSKEEGSRVILKNGYERTYFNSIDNITYGDRRIRVDYSDVYFDDSTIILKDGRLISPYNLKQGDSISVVTHGSNVASVITVEGVTKPTTELVVYRGRIEEVLNRELELYRPTIVDGIEKDSSRRSYVKITDDTQILDVREASPKKISVKDFLDSGLHSSNKYNEYYNEYVYTVVRDGVALAINIVNPNSEADAITTANIGNINLDNETITIKDIKDWSNLTQTWKINNSSSITLDIEDGIFIKNGKPVDMSQISTKDNIYVMRRNNKGYIIICR